MYRGKGTHVHLEQRLMPLISLSCSDSEAVVDCGVWLEFPLWPKNIAYSDGVPLEKRTCRAECYSLGRGSASDVLAVSRATGFGLTLCWKPGAR